MLVDELKSLPSSSGVYQYFDAAGKLLYVGKAKVLKNRVRSYFVFTPSLAPNPKNSARIQKMIREAAHIEWIETASESDALILENSFIKQLKPKYNILLRDDKTYPYIYADLNEPFARFEITRKIIKGKNIRYFGPFYKGAKEILEAIYGEFKLVQKRSCVKGKKACIFHQIGRCSAPCENKISQQDYAQILNSAIKKLKNPRDLLPNLRAKMQDLALNENYEEAAKLRDCIEKIEDISVKVQIDLAKLEDFEAIAICSDKNMLCSVHFSVREGKISYSSYNITAANDVGSDDLGQIYKQVLLEAYPPEKPVNSSRIYVYVEFDDMDLVGEILSQRHGRKFEIIAPKIGEKLKICQIAYQNASSLIQKHLKTGNYEFLRQIQEYFSLQNLPLKIECFDNSHLFGQAPVGAMIAWNTDKFDKSSYRHMHLNAKNDYDQMNEMLTARALSFDKLAAPDLWVLDGGDALLNLAKNIISSSGANVDILAIAKEKIDAKAHRAKGSANDKIYGELAKFSLSPNDPKLQFFQRLRDEAHRFAITFHRKTRKNQDLQSSALQNKGISAGSIKKLIDYFGSFENIAGASFDEIQKVTNKSVAQKLKGG